MQKQPHRTIEKTADNRYWQDQTWAEDTQAAPAAEFQAWEPPTLHPDKRAAGRGQAPRVADGASLRTPRADKSG